MALDSIVRGAVKLANTQTVSLQDVVQFYAWIGSDSDSAPMYADALELKALVEMKQRLRRLPGGQEVTQNAQVTFLEPVPANGAEGRREPIDPRDKIVLPSGHTGPIYDVAGLVDPGTHSPFYAEVALG